MLIPIIDFSHVCIYLALQIVSSLWCNFETFPNFGIMSLLISIFSLGLISILFLRLIYHNIYGALTRLSVIFYLVQTLFTFLLYFTLNITVFVVYVYYIKNSEKTADVGMAINVLILLSSLILCVPNSLIYKEKEQFFSSCAFGKISSKFEENRNLIDLENVPVVVIEKSNLIYYVFFWRYVGFLLVSIQIGLFVYLS